MMNDTQHDSSNIHVAAAAATAYRLLYTNVFTCFKHIGITLYIYLSLSVVTEIFETTPQAVDGRPWSDTAAAACYYANLMYLGSYDCHFGFLLWEDHAWIWIWAYYIVLKSTI